jgi:hypothetical protein
MQFLKKHTKFLTVLVISFVMALNMQAQPSLLAVTQKSGKIFVSDGISKKLVASSVNNIQPLAAANHVYYINNAISDKMTIKAYDVASNTTTEVVKAETLVYGVAADKKITNMVYGQTANKIYFSTVSVNAQGYEDYLTWALDPVTNDVKVLADGKVSAVDNTGAVQIEIHGVDEHGSYTQAHLNKLNGTADVLGVRKYTTASASTSSNN